MSVLKLELKKEHLLLLKHLKCRLTEDDVNIVLSITEDNEFPITEDEKYSFIDLILNGKPAVFNPLETEELVQHSTEQKAEWDKLYAELPLALEIILFNGSFELGTFRARFHDRQWEKLN
jgi:hypothetical protein